MFGRQGCELTTIEEICELADVARKTFYNHYSSKQQLIQSLSESLLYGETANLIDLALERYGSTRDRLAFFFSRVQLNLERYGALERVLVLRSIQDIAVDDGRAGRQLALINAEFSRLYASGGEQDELAMDSSVEFLAELTVSMMNGVVLNWVHQENYPVAARIDELVRLLQQVLLGARW